MVCDSNILIYAAEPGDTLCLPLVQRTDALPKVGTGYPHDRLGLQVPATIQLTPAGSVKVRL